MLVSLARVITRHTNRAEVCLNSGDIYTCHVPRKFSHVLVGDQVRVRLEADKAIIETICPRHSTMIRPQARGEAKALAANLDQLLIVIAAEPAGCEKLLDRYLIIAQCQAIPATIIFNKCDLLNEQSLAEKKRWLIDYESIGYTVIITSAQSGVGMQALQEQLTDKISIFIGQSGVGKSSLLNCLLPNAQQLVNALSDDSRLGRHTTTASRLYSLPQGGAIIDSPGVREFSLHQMDRITIRQGFIEFNRYADTCKFRDCWHSNEPQCAVKQAVEQGEISQQRFISYQRLLSPVREKIIN